MNKTVMITGASRGLGLAFAYEYAKKGYTIIIVARREEKLQEIAKQLQQKFQVDVKVYSCDLSNIHSMENVIRQIEASKIAIDILINNAGMGSFGIFTDNNLEKELSVIDVNIKGLTYLTHRIGTWMKLRKAGKILNVASVVACYPLPYQAVYAASKAYVLSFSQAIHSEFSEDGVMVATLLPGNIKTGFEVNSGLKQLYDVIRQRNPKRFKEMTAEVVARKAVVELEKGTRLIYPDKRIAKQVKWTKFYSQDKLTDYQYRQRSVILNSKNDE